MSYPVYLSSFVGRKAELGEIKSLIREKSTRLLTLTGSGGSGKTRLAYEAITQLASAFEDGLVWVELVGLADPLAVPQAVASALEMNTAPGQTVLQALTAFLQHREALIVLDNCEHLIQACSGLVDGLLRACPALHILATSRQRLAVEGEQVWPVPPLAYPTADALPLDALTRYDALQLFAARARQARPEFEIDAHNAPALIKIARLLEGLPLAIELTAARVNLLGLPQMAERLENQLPFLADRGHSSDARHQSMRETIRWSYDLLSGPEKTLFRRLGVFAGGFSLAAAEAVCDAPPLAEAEILDLTGRLIDKSLLVRESGQRGDSRYRQLESIRQYAGEALRDAEEESLLRDRHLLFFSELVREAEPHLQGPEQRIWTEKLDADYDNVQAALSWVHHKAAKDGRWLATAAQMADGLFWFWSYTERHEEGTGWYKKVLEFPGLERDSKAYADLTRHMGTFLWLLGDYTAAQVWLHHSLESAQVVDHPLGIAHAKLVLGIISLHQAQFDQATGLLHESEVLLQGMGDQRTLVIARVNLGGVYLETGDLDAARRYSEKAVINARANDDLWGLGLSLSGLGNTLYRQGAVEEAQRLIEEAVETIEQTGQHWLRAEALWRWAEMMRDQGDFQGAEKRLEQCYELAQESGATQWQLSALESLGLISLSRGRNRQAAGRFSEVLRITAGQDHPNILLDVFAGIVQLAAHEGQTEQAVTLWEAYEGLKTARQLPAAREEARTFDLIQSHIEAPPFPQARRAGSAYSLEQAVSLALEITREVEKRVDVVPSEYDLRLLALGPTNVYVKGRPLVASDWTFAKPKELLFYLASNQPKTKEQIGLVFWPDASPKQLRTSLRAALYHLRRALGQREWILYEDGYYRFNREMDFWYDVEAFEEGAEEAKTLVGTSPERAIGKLESATQLYRGDFLLDIASDEWATLRREELKHKYLAAMNTLGELYVDRGAHDRAVEVYHALLDIDNLLEEAHRGLMRAYALQGERGLALGQYQTLVDLFLDELGVPPSPETAALYQALLQNTL